MRRWVMAAVLVAAGVVVLALVLTGIQRQRLNADREACRFRFMQLGQFAAEYTKGTAELKAGELPPPDVPLAIPPGTVPNPSLTPDRRLSWVCGLLNFLDQSTQATAAVAERIDLNAAWDAEVNREAANTPLKMFLCPGALPELPDGQPAPTQFVGLAGVGHDAAELPLTAPLSPRAGCFRYDTPTPLPLIRNHDGLSTTFLLAETSDDLGPWIRGGFSTVRGLDTRDGSKPPLGRGGQFGGNYPGVVGFGRADGSAWFATDRMSVEVLRAHLTIAGGEGELIPGGD